MFSLSGKTILVTGASSGIGRQIAVACSVMDARVILLGRNWERLGETLAAMQNPDFHLRYSVDLAEYEKIESIVKDATGMTGKIHGLVHCAGISSTLPLRVINMEKVADLFRINVFSAINLTKIVCKQAYIVDDGASIVFVSSVMGIVGEAGKSLYGMTKGALIAAAKSLAVELAPRKIRVNCVSPGVVVTPMSQSSFYSQSEETLNKIRSLHPLGIGRVEDVANPCVFMLSDAARWITGTNFIVDGGYTAR